MGPPTTQASSAPSLDVQSTKDTYIPLFSGAPQDYKEWRKRINIYYKKMELTNRKAEAVLNLIGSLQGTAWKLVEDFNLDDAGKDSAWRDILKKLDAAFQYDARVQLPNDFDSYFNLQRSPGQTLLQYVTTHDELYRKVSEHSVTLPVFAQASWPQQRPEATGDDPSTWLGEDQDPRSSFPALRPGLQGRWTLPWSEMERKISWKGLCRLWGGRRRLLRRSMGWSLLWGWRVWGHWVWIRPCRGVRSGSHLLPRGSSRTFDSRGAAPPRWGVRWSLRCLCRRSPSIQRH